MNRRTIKNILYVVGIILMVCFVMIILIDYINYDNIVTSAPFSTILLVRIIEFFIPSIIFFLIGKFLKIK